MAPLPPEFKPKKTPTDFEVFLKQQPKIAETIEKLADLHAKQALMEDELGARSTHRPLLQPQQSGLWAVGNGWNDIDTDEIKDIQQKSYKALTPEQRGKLEALTDAMVKESTALHCKETVEAIDAFMKTPECEALLKQRVEQMRAEKKNAEVPIHVLEGKAFSQMRLQLLSDVSYQSLQRGYDKVAAHYEGVLKGVHSDVDAQMAQITKKRLDNPDYQPAGLEADAVKVEESYKKLFMDAAKHVEGAFKAKDRKELDEYTKKNRAQPEAAIAAYKQSLIPFFKAKGISSPVVREELMDVLRKKHLEGPLEKKSNELFFKEREEMQGIIAQADAPAPKVAMVDAEGLPMLERKARAL